MAGAVKTSGAKALHDVCASRGWIVAGGRGRGNVPWPYAPSGSILILRRQPSSGRREGKVFLDSTRAGGATVVSAYSPRIRPGVSVSFPVAWDDIDDVAPADFTIHNAAGLLDGADPWADQMPPAQPLDADLVAEGHTVPVARVQAMHEGKRRARTRPKS
jgi:hypothetical protein